MNDVPLKSHSDDEVNFHDILRMIKESKKLLIFLIVIFTILAILYSQTLKPSFKSSALLRIGYIEISPSQKSLFESPNELAQHITINLLINHPDSYETPDSFKKYFNFTPIEQKLLNIEITSNSQENNQKIFDSIMTDTMERHSKLSKVRREYSLEKLNNSIKKIDQEIEFFKNQSFDWNFLIAQFNKEERSQEVDRLFENYIFNITNEERIYKLKKERENLEYELLDIESQTIFQTKIAKGFETYTINPKTKIFIAMGPIFGFFTGIFLLFFLNLVKNYRQL